jgi:hypothetical protein
MIEHHSVVRTSRAAATSLPSGPHPWAGHLRTPSSHVLPASPDPAPTALRTRAARGMSIPLASEFRRCSTKGCVFPAAVQGMGKCWLHQLEELEPRHFLSCQPTQLVLDQAKFGLPDEECDNSRVRDRRRLAALREQFLEDVA